MKTKTNETIQTRIALPVTVAAALLVAALSTGNALFLGASAMVWTLIAAGYLGVRRVAETLTVAADLTERTVQRGEYGESLAFYHKESVSQPHHQ